MDQMPADPRLRMLEPLGTGGTASVVKAYHPQLQQTIAVKRWRPESGTSQDEFLGLISREHNLIGDCRFPGLVRVVEPPNQESPQLMLEYCPGPTLDQIDGPIDIPTAINILSALALDLEFLRVAGLVHGDLKPQNIFLPDNWSELHQGQLSYVKLSDFSFGCRVNTEAGARLGLGTIGYMAPETIAGAEITHRSDLFALGVVAYQLLTGVHPFLSEDSDPVSVNSRIREQETPSLSELRPEISPELDRVVTRLLAKDQDARPESGWAACLELERAGATYPFRKAWRPAHLFRVGHSFDDYLTSLLDLQDKESDRVRELTDGKSDALRLLLTANYVKDRLSYNGDRFRFTDTIYWPHRMRARLLEQFSASSFGKRRALVLAAASGGRESATQLGLAERHDLSHAHDGLTMLLRPLLKVGTLKNISRRYALKADRLDRHELATHLHLQSGNLDEAERCADLAAREFSRTNKNTDALALLHTLDLRSRTAGKEFECRRALILTGNIHKEIGELDQAEAIYDRIVKLYTDHPVDKLLAETYKNLGEMYRLRQDSQSALAALQRSLDVFRDLDDELEISHTLVNIGNVHGTANDMRLAVKNYRAAYKIQRRLDARTELASTLHNMASIFCLDGRIKRGIFLLEHALTLKKEIGHQGEIARTLNNLGYAYQITDQPAKAAEYITESLEINRRIGSKQEVLYNLENLVALRISAGQLKDALQLLDEGHALATEHSLDAHVAGFYLYRATIAKRMGRYSDAIKSLAEADTLLPEIDDPALDLNIAVQKASLRYHLGDNPSALKLAIDVLTRARKTNNATSELDALLLIVRLTGERQFWDQGCAIVDERRLNREKRLLTFGRIEYLLDHNENDAALELADDPICQLAEVEQDLELPWMESLAGHVSQILGRVEDAHRHLSRSLTAAQIAGLQPELITVQVLQGKLAKAQGDFEGAFGCLKRALDAGRTVAGSIDNAGDRKLYQMKPIMQTLAAEIKALKGELGTKQKAGR